MSCYEQSAKRTAIVCATIFSTVAIVTIGTVVSDIWGQPPRPVNETTIIDWCSRASAETRASPVCLAFADRVKEGRTKP